MYMTLPSAYFNYFVQSSTTEEIYQQVAEQKNYKLNLLRLSFGGQLMESSSELTLEDCGLYNHATILALYRVSGGATYSQGRVIGENVKMSTKPDDITLTADDPTMELPCGHTMAPESLAEAIDDQIKSYKTELQCPLCHKKWNLSQIKDMGLTAEEKQSMEVGLGKNLFFEMFNVKQCPQCNTFIEKMHEGIRIKCPTCKNYEFCWICMRQWIKPGSGYKICGNYNCDPKNSDLTQLLKTCNEVAMSYTDNKLKAPAVRACPNCREGINHDGGCKHMQCPKCFTNFCFVCLSVYDKKNGSWPCGSYKDICKVAPRQTVIIK